MLNTASINNLHGLIKLSKITSKPSLLNITESNLIKQKSDVGIMPDSIKIAIKTLKFIID